MRIVGPTSIAVTRSELIDLAYGAVMDWRENVALYHAADVETVAAFRAWCDRHEISNDTLARFVGRFAEKPKQLALQFPRRTR